MYSVNTSLGAVFAERFDDITRDLKKPVFLKGDGIWIDVLPTITKQYNRRINTFIKLTPIEVSLK